MTTVDRNWVTSGEWPGTYAEAIARDLELKNEQLKIETQLATRKPDGHTPEDEYADFIEWRRRALGAKGFFRREREALRVWMARHNPVGFQKIPSLKATLAQRLDELQVDYSVDQLDNLRRRFIAESLSGRLRLMLLEVLDMFREHGVCPPDCSACALLTQIEQELTH